MRLRDTLVLFGVAAALVLFMAIFERGTRSTDERLEADRLAFPDFKKNRDRADAVEILRSGAKTVFVRRDIGTKDERWYVTQPVECRADNSRVIGLLGAFERAGRFRVEENKRWIPVVPTTNLGQYGLDQDSATRIRIAAGDETLLDVFIGCKTAGGERAYAMTAERDEVYVVEEDVRENANRRLDEFRDKRLLDLRAGVVTQFTILEKGKPLVEFARAKDGPWRMVSPVTDRADDVMAGEIADKLGSLWADDFKQDFAVGDPEMPKKLAEWGLRPALRSVKLTLDVDGKLRRHEVLFGEKIKKTTGPETSWDVYAMVDGSRTVVRMPDDVIEKIDVKPDDLRDHRVFAFEKSDVRSLAVYRPAGPLVLEKTGDEWKLTKPEEREADGRRVEELLDELADLRLQKFLPFGTELLDPIRVRVASGSTDKVTRRGEVAQAGEHRVASGSTNKVTRRGEVVFFEDVKGGSTKARRGEAGAVFEVPAAVLEKLGASKFRYWDRTVLKFDHLDVRKIAVTCGEHAEAAVGRKVKDKGGKERIEWKLAGGGEVDVGAADSIKWDFSDLEAEELLGPLEEAKLRAYGLEAPSARVELAVKSGQDEVDKTYALRVGSLARSGEVGIKRYYAKFEDDPMVFLLRESVVKRIRKGLAGGREADRAEGEGEK